MFKPFLLVFLCLNMWKHGVENKVGTVKHNPCAKCLMLHGAYRCQCTKVGILYAL